MFRNRFLAFAVLVSLVMTLMPFGQPAAAISSSVVISQVYGGGGNSGAPYQNDFVELFNRGAATISVAGWSIQYTSAAGTGTFGNASNQITPLSGSIAPGHYLLVQEASNAAVGAPLPLADVTDSTPIPMAAGGGKVALVNTTTPLGCNGSAASPCSVAALATVVDLIGYDGATFFESSPAPMLSNTTAALRKNAGCTETDNNSADFEALAPAPRNTSSPVHFCTGDNAPAVTATSPLTNATDVSFNTNIAITFTEPVDVSTAWYTISCATSGAHAATQSGGPTTFTLDPITDFGFSESCTVTVLASEVTDQDTVDPPNNMLANYVFSFTTEATPPPPTFIHDIQGAAHISPVVGQTFGNVPGIVTAKRANGFNMQDPNPDSDAATSEGIFVFTSSPPTSVNVGDAVRVKATVSEFRPGGATSANLTTTELASPKVTVLSHGNPLPPATVIGIGGRMPPTSIIEDDATSTGDVETSGVFDPASDGLDFYESLEGMLVQINDPVIVGPTNSFNEIPVLPDDGSWAGPRTAHGGILYSYGDGNPERIIVDDGIVPMPQGLNVGDHFAGSVTGVVDYNFGLFMVELTQSPVRVPGSLAKETTASPTVNELTVATFNVQNLDPGDGAAKFSNLASLIVNNMKSPDLIAVEEVQDNNGATDDGVVDPSLTIGTLIAAISSAGGPTYGYRQINPVNDKDGGEPGGNIRQIFLFRTDRGLSFVDRPGGDSTTATTVTSVGGAPQLSFSPGRIDPTNTAWNTSRKPLAAEFEFDGQHLFVIANHFNSKGGDQPLTGRFQPPTRSSEVQRHEQATSEAGFVQQIRAIDPNANVVVLGDLNDFEFSETVQILEAAGLTDLYDTLPLAERYSYVFQGNSQTLDHILVSSPLAGRSTLDVVHVNAEFADQASDHDPSVVRIVLNDASTLCGVSVRVSAKDGIASSLCAKLQNAAAAQDRGDLKAAQNILRAFTNEVNAQRGKAISTEDADLLILLASRL